VLADPLSAHHITHELLLKEPMTRNFAIAGLALVLAACVQQPPPGAAAGQSPPGNSGRGYFGRYQVDGPVTNYNPYELPEYRGGYTPY
jgi:hypothetical protein